MFSLTTKRTALAGLFALLAAVPAGAVIIDDFSDAQGPLTGLAVDVQVGSMLGGERDVIVLSDGSFQVSGGAATASGANVTLFYDGVDGAATTSAFGLVGADLTDGGLSDRFLLNVTSNTAAVTVSFLVFESLGNALVSSTNVAGPGLFTFLFSNLVTAGLRANLADAKQITVNLRSLENGATLVFDNFCTGNASGCVGAASAEVPEPGTWALLAGGLALLGLRRRRRAQHVAPLHS